MSYPVKCAWIYREREIGSDMYIVKNERLLEEYIMTGREVDFIESMDGETDPIPLLTEYFAMNESQARICVKVLEERRIIRSRSFAESGFSETAFKFLNVQSLRLPAKIFLYAACILAVPILWLGLHGLNREVLADIFAKADTSAWKMWMGTISGLLAGVLLHEMLRAAAIIVSPKRVTSVLAGAMGNLIVMSLGFFACRTAADNSAVFYMSGLVNLECALFSIAFIKVTFMQVMVPALVLINIGLLILL